MKTSNENEQVNTAEQMFSAASNMPETLRKGARWHWENQDRILDAMQAFSDGWFKRRHAGTRAALEAAERMCKAQTPLALLREYQEWANGAFQRVLADGLAYQQQCISAAAFMQPFGAPGEQETASPQVEVGRATRFEAA
jgi:hypothetical protein